MTTFSIEFVARIMTLSVMLILVWFTMYPQSKQIEGHQQVLKMQDIVNYLDNEINYIMLAVPSNDSSVNKTFTLPQDFNYYYTVNLSCNNDKIWIWAETPSIGKSFIIKKNVKCSSSTASGTAYPGENCIMGRRLGAAHNYKVNLTLVRECD
jgi:hypothetical protein